PRLRAQRGRLVEGIDGSLRERSGRRVIEEDLVAGNGPRVLARAKLMNLVTHGSTSGVGTPASGAAASMRRGSRASRSASPRRLKPSTAAPIARPGKTDVQGALRRRLRSRPSAIMP